MKFHCSACGRELVHTRKAIPGKGKIIDLIEPHECCGHAYKGGEDEQPTVLDILDSLKPVGPIISTSDGESEDVRGEPGDLREGGNGQKSSAPRGLLQSMGSLPSVGGEKGGD